MDERTNEWAEVLLGVFFLSVYSVSYSIHVPYSGLGYTNTGEDRDPAIMMFVL